MRAPTSPKNSPLRTDLAAARTHDAALATSHGSNLGTLPYSPPELVASRDRSFGPTGDVYSLGAILYHILSGDPPYLGASSQEGAESDLLTELRTGPPKSVDEVAPKAPAELRAICRKAMARHPGRRYADAREFAEDLGAFLDRRVVRAYKSGAFVELRLWFARNRKLAISVLAVVGLIVGISTTSAVVLEMRNRAIWRLATLQDHEDLMRRADSLWPAVPALIPELEAWLADAREIAARLPRMRQDLAALDGKEGSENRWWRIQLEEAVRRLEDLNDRQGGLISESPKAHSSAYGWSIPRRIEFAEMLERGDAGRWRVGCPVD